MDAIEEIKQRLNIEDVVAQYVQLKRAGRNFKGLSPFTNEKTPSFMVSPEKQIWHDFSSGKGGNIFSFVMDMEGMDFKTALDYLARQAGVDMSQFQSGNSSQRAKERERLLEALEIATKFYQLHLTKNAVAANYVTKTRKFNKQSILVFRIGYSPNNGKALINLLKKRGFSDKELKQAGLATMRRAGLSDMFSGRIMIPLADPTGRIIGFTARSLEENDAGPKYINTPQTLVYDKSRHIYGLHAAKTAIRLKKYAVIVEGNLDVIASHQAGAQEVVATAGTAITQYHLKGLSRFTSDIRLSFDQDSAGIKASERAIPIASKVGINLSMITLSGAKDPDELIQKNPAAWEKAIQYPIYALDWLIDKLSSEIDITSAPGKRQFSDELVSVISKLTDQVEQDHYLSRVAEILGVSKDALQAKLSTGSDSNQTARLRQKQPAVAPDIEDHKIQDHLLALCMVHTELRQYLQPITFEMVTNKDAAAILTYLQQHSAAIVPEALDRGLQSVDDYIKILLLQYEELYGDLDILELHYEASRLQTQLIQQYVKKQKQALAFRLSDATEPDTQHLLQRVKELDALLKLSRGAAHD